MPAPDKARRDAMRRLYEHDQLTIAAIAAQCGVTRATISRWVRADGWTRKSGPDAGRGEPVDRRALVARAWRNAERQLRLVEKKMRAHGDTPLDESARLIATLVKTLRELAALDRALADNRNDDGGPRADHADSAIPRDLDTFYEELAARMDRLRQERDGNRIAGESSAGAD